MRNFVWFLTALGSLVGGAILFGVALLAEGAPQQGAGAAVAVAFGVLPYVFARSVDEMMRDGRSYEERDRLVAAFKSSAPPKV